MKTETEMMLFYPSEDETGPDEIEGEPPVTAAAMPNTVAKIKTRRYSHAA
ncbi:MAG: hypothetical protein LBJ12_06820 [Oscillospiraceae bacterium]|jgi:hypothetical protein|nr:hypothetical protein [Oscillospiraceae bacterium]